MIDYNMLIQWIFFGVVGGSFMFAVNILSQLRRSIDELNVKMATIITTISYHEKTIEILKQEIDIIRENHRGDYGSKKAYRNT